MVGEDSVKCSTCDSKARFGAAVMAQGAEPVGKQMKWSAARRGGGGSADDGALTDVELWRTS